MKKKDGWISFLAFSCIHAPLQDEDAIAWMIEQIKDVGPDVIIHLGDGHEADAASRWMSEADWTLTEEFVAHNEILKKIRKAAPSAKKIFCQGNHDQNLLEIGRIDKRIRERCDYRNSDNDELMKFWEHAAEYVNCRRRGCFRLGEVVFSHGFETGAKAGENEAVYFCNEWGLYVHGHTHRPTPHIMRAMKTGRVPLRYWYANPGCMRDLNPDYMKRNRSEMWGQGVVVGQCQVNKSPRREKTWDAEVRVFRMFDDAGS